MVGGRGGGGSATLGQFDALSVELVNLRSIPWPFVEGDRNKRICGRRLQKDG